jgi:hypothetical protein
MTKKEMEEKLRWWLEFIQIDIESLPDKERSLLQVEFAFYYTPSLSSANIPAGWWYPVEDLKTIQGTIKEFLEQALRQRKPEDGIITLPPLSRQLRVRDDGRFEITYPRHMFAPGKHKRPVPNKEWLIADFSELLNGIPRDAIKQCEECKKLFLHLSGKQKKYCSSQCAYKFLSRKKREKLRSQPRKYQAYLKRQRELMKRKYDEKIKSEHPMARIGRKER